MVYDLNTYEPKFSLKGHKDTVICVKINANEDLIATASMDATIKIWTLNGDLKYTLEGPTDEITYMEWHKKSNAILASSADASIWIWNA